MEQLWKTVYLCEDSVEGIFTGVYDAWSERKTKGTQELRVEKNEGIEIELFAEYIAVTPDAEKSTKVIRSVERRISSNYCEYLLKAAMSDAWDRAQVIYKTMQIAFAKGRDMSRDLTDPWNCRLMEIVRNYGNEEHLMTGFLRFDSYGEHRLLAIMEPKNHILPALMAHFSERMNTEDFIIVDKRRGMAGVHRAVSEGDTFADWILLHLTIEQTEQLCGKENKKDPFRKLWKTFFDTVAIEERRNEKCQRNHCPLWYRPYMHEFKDGGSAVS